MAVPSTEHGQTDPAVSGDIVQDDVGDVRTGTHGASIEGNDDARGADPWTAASNGDGQRLTISQPSCELINHDQAFNTKRQFRRAPSGDSKRVYKNSNSCNSSGNSSDPGNSFDPGGSAASSLDISDLAVVHGKAACPSGVKKAKVRCRGTFKTQQHARISATRASTAIAAPHVANIIEAVTFASARGLLFNRYITLNMEQAGTPNALQAMSAFLKYAADWLRLREVAITYVWARERGLHVGDHAHILLHVPKVLAKQFGKLQRKWLLQSGFSLKRGVRKTKSIGYGYAHADIGVRYGEQYSDHLNRLVGYILKGVEAPAASKFGISARDEGVILGKRSGTSQNIGKAARRAHNDSLLLRSETA